MKKLSLIWIVIFLIAVLVGCKDAGSADTASPSPTAGESQMSAAAPEHPEDMQTELPESERPTPESEEPHVISGVYEVGYSFVIVDNGGVADVEGNGDIVFSPWLKIDTSDCSFVFMYGMNANPVSYPEGNYKIEGNLLTARVGPTSTFHANFGDGYKEHYMEFYFEIIDGNTLKFLGGNYAYESVKKSTMYETGVETGDIFTWDREKPI